VAAELLGCQHVSFSIKKGALWWFSRRERNGLMQTTLRLVMTTEFL
jgi:phosphohistidine phosphatase